MKMKHQDLRVKIKMSLIGWKGIIGLNLIIHLRQVTISVEQLIRMIQGTLA